MKKKSIAAFLLILIMAVNLTAIGAAENAPKLWQWEEEYILSIATADGEEMGSVTLLLMAEEAPRLTPTDSVLLEYASPEDGLTLQSVADAFAALGLIDGEMDIRLMLEDNGTIAITQPGIYTITLRDAHTGDLYQSYGLAVADPEQDSVVMADYAVPLTGPEQEGGEENGSDEGIGGSSDSIPSDPVEGGEYTPPEPDITEPETSPQQDAPSTQQGGNDEILGGADSLHNESTDAEDSTFDAGYLTKKSLRRNMSCDCHDGCECLPDACPCNTGAGDCDCDACGTPPPSCDCHGGCECPPETCPCNTGEGNCHCGACGTLPPPCDCHDECECPPETCPCNTGEGNCHCGACGTLPPPCDCHDGCMCPAETCLCETEGTCDCGACNAIEPEPEECDCHIGCKCPKDTCLCETEGTCDCGACNAIEPEPEECDCHIGCKCPKDTCLCETEGTCDCGACNAIEPEPEECGCHIGCTCPKDTCLCETEGTCDCGACNAVEPDPVKPPVNVGSDEDDPDPEPENETDTPVTPPVENPVNPPAAPSPDNPAEQNDISTISEATAELVAQRFADVQLVRIEDSDVPLGPYVALDVEKCMNYGEAVQ